MIEILSLHPKMHHTDDDLVHLVEMILRAERRTGIWQVTIVLTTDDHLRGLHAQFLDIDEVTDVMTFPASNDEVSGGDILISVDRATEQADEANHTPPAEIRYLVAHGVLHLTGWTDSHPESRIRMMARQDELLAISTPA